MNKKIRLYAAARNQGHAAAAASTRATTCVTLGDQNLTAEEVLNNPLCRPLVLHASLIAASDGVWDNNGWLHQDLIVVDADPGVRMAPIRSDVIGFDRSHQAVRARIRREPPKPVEVRW